MGCGQIQYSLLEEQERAVVADLTIWKLSDDRYDVYFGRHSDLLKAVSKCSGSANFRDLSASTKIFSLQGPDSLNILGQLTDPSRLRALNYFEHGAFDIAGFSCQLGRLGYTGEKGFEIVVDDPDQGTKLWNRIAEMVPPAGLIAADILRIEAGFILFLNECRLGCSASELGLAQFSSSIPTTSRYQLVSFTATADSAVLPWSVQQHPNAPGRGELLVTSACQSSLVEAVLGLGLVVYDHDFKSQLVDPKGVFSQIEVVGKPYYNPAKTVPREAWPLPHH